MSKKARSFSAQAVPFPGAGAGGVGKGRPGWERRICESSSSGQCAMQERSAPIISTS